MVNTPSTPQYRVLADTFFSPKMVAAGSIVATHAPPGHHLQPLNEAAHDAMEKWYDEDYPVIDKDGKDTGQTHKPHMQFRQQLYEPGVNHHVEVLADPTPTDMTNSLSLAEVHQQARPDTDQRPGPAGAFAEPVPEAVAVAEQSGAEIVEEAKQTGLKAGVKVT